LAKTTQPTDPLAKFALIDAAAIVFMTSLENFITTLKRCAWA
jgi:hypothetical protein